MNTSWIDRIRVFRVASGVVLLATCLIACNDRSSSSSSSGSTQLDSPAANSGSEEPAGPVGPVPLPSHRSSTGIVQAYKVVLRILGTPDLPETERLQAWSTLRKCEDPLFVNLAIAYSDDTRTVTEHFVTIDPVTGAQDRKVYVKEVCRQWLYDFFCFCDSCEVVTDWKAWTTAKLEQWGSLDEIRTRMASRHELHVRPK